MGVELHRKQQYGERHSCSLGFATIALEEHKNRRIELDQRSA